VYPIIVSPSLPFAGPLGECRAFHRLDRREVPRLFFLWYRQVPDAYVYARVIQPGAVPVVGVPLGLHVQPQVEGGNVFRPQEEFIFQLELRFRDQAEGLEGFVQVFLGRRLLRARDAQVAARPLARCGRQVFTRALTSLM
jgi:hypothetical protein